MLLADLPTHLSLGQLSISAILTIILFLITVFGLITQLGSSGVAKRTTRRNERVPRVAWIYLAYISSSFIIVCVYDGFSLQYLQNYLIYTLFILLIYVVSRLGPVSSVEKSWAFLRSVATISAFVFLLVQLIIPSLLGARSMAIAALVALAIVVPGKPENIFVRVAPYTLVLSQLLSLSRTAAAIGLLFLVFVVLRNKRGLRLLLAAFLLAVVVLVGFLAVRFFEPLRDRFLVGDNALQLGGATISTQGRVTLWDTLLASIEGSWFFGNGLGSAYATLSANGLPNDPHNEYLRFYFEFGLVGVLLFLMMWSGLVFRSLSNARVSDHPVHWASAIGLLAIGAVAVTDNPFVYGFGMAPLAVLIGLSLAHANHEDMTAAGNGAAPVRRPLTFTREQPRK